MNLIQVQEQLKGLPTQAIMAYANGQNPEVPPYVALAELNRRKQLEKAGVAMQSGQKPTIKDQVEQSVGLMGLQQAQQKQALQQAAQNMPTQGIPEGAPQGPVQGEPEGFAGGGAVAFDDGRDVGTDPNDMYFMEPKPVPGVIPGTSLDDVAAMLRGEKRTKEPRITEEQKKGLAEVANRITGGTPQTKLSPDAAEGLAALASNIETGKIRPNTPNRFYTSDKNPEVTSNPLANTTPEQKPAVPPPTVVAKNIAQGKPAATPAAEGIEAVANKVAQEALLAKPDLKASMAEAAAAVPKSGYESEYEKNLREKRARDLARREAPKSWLENEGLMAQLRGFAQADPRRPWGAGAAASADYQQQLMKQRAAEDDAFLAGLAGLNKSEQERLKAQFDYAAKLAEKAQDAKHKIIGDVYQRQSNKETNETHLKTNAATNATQMAIANMRIEEQLAKAKTPEERAFAVMQKVQSLVQTNPEYKKAADMASMPGKLGDTARATMRRIEQEMFAKLAPDLASDAVKSGIATGTNTGVKKPDLDAALALYGPKK